MKFGIRKWGKNTRSVSVSKGQFPNKAWCQKARLYNLWCNLASIKRPALEKGQCFLREPFESEWICFWDKFYLFLYQYNKTIFFGTSNQPTLIQKFIYLLFWWKYYKWSWNSCPSCFQLVLQLCFSKYPKLHSSSPMAQMEDQMQIGLVQKVKLLD